MKSPRTVTLPIKHVHLLHRCPNFSKTGSIIGMRKKFYGKHAQLVRCGSYIYNVTGQKEQNQILSLSH